MVNTVQSADGTRIAFDRFGEGPAVIVVGGALMNRHSPTRTVRRLAQRFAVFSYDRRGRGDSGDTQPYSVEREFEDLAAVIGTAGGDAAVFGMSSGSFIVLEAAVAGTPINKLAVYEPPYLTGHEHSYLSAADYTARLHEVVDAGHPDQAVELFLRQVSGGWFDESMRATEYWPSMVALGPSLRYDAALTGTGRVPTERLHAITVPVLALSGGDSEAWAGASAGAVVGAVRNGASLVLAGQTHRVDEDVLATALIDFFETGNSRS